MLKELKELIVNKDPKSRFSEAINNVRTNLQFLSVNGPCKNILITSPCSGDGKSFVSANLAVSFAQLGMKVLIVDCDMRKGRQHEIFELNNNRGLSNLLLKDLSVRKTYIQKTCVDNVWVLPRGIVPPNPSELLSSKKLEQLVELLNNDFDLIIWDGAPVTGLSDSLIMSNIVDKIILVCSYKQTPLELLENAKKTLGNFENKLAGFIINRMPVKENKYYYNSKYYS